MDQEEQFLPLWKEYFAYMVQQHQFELTEEGVDISEDNDRYYENPFLVFYESENLYKMAQQLGLQSGTEIWEPSEHQLREIRPFMAILSHSMVKFINWIDEKIGEPR